MCQRSKDIQDCAAAMVGNRIVYLEWVILLAHVLVEVVPEAALLERVVLVLEKVVFVAQVAVEVLPVLPEVNPLSIVRALEEEVGMDSFGRITCIACRHSILGVRKSVHGIVGICSKDTTVAFCIHGNLEPFLLHPLRPKSHLHRRSRRKQIRWVTSSTQLPGRVPIHV